MLLLAFAPLLSARELVLAVARTPLSLPFYVAREMGYFSDEQLDIRFSEVTGGHRALQLLFKGEAELATASDTALMYNSLERSDFASLGYFVSSSSDMAVISRSAVPTMTPQAWQGRKIGFVPHSSSEYLLHTWLLFHNLDVQQLQLVPLQAEQMLSALETNQVQATSIWQPYAFQIEQSLEGSSVLPKSDLHTLTFHLIANKPAINQHLDDYTAVLRALRRAERFIAQNPQQAKSLLRSQLNVDTAFIDWMLGRYNYRLSMDQALITSLENQARWAIENTAETPGIAVPNYLDFIDTRALRRVSPQAVTVIE